MEKKYPPRVWVGDFGHGVIGQVACANKSIAENIDKYGFGFPKPQLVTEYISKEEHDALVQPLVEALEFTIHATEYLYDIKKDLPKGLDPTFYHTLSYEGDMELRDKAIKARSALENYRNMGEGK